MPAVYNRKNGNVPEGAVYIGTPTKWRSPFIIDLDEPKWGCTREELHAKYRAHLEANPELLQAVKDELRGKDLECFCHPLPCHGDILLEIANSDTP